MKLTKCVVGISVILFTLTTFADVATDNRGSDGNFLLPACHGAIKKIDDSAGGFDFLEGYCVGVVHAVLDMTGGSGKGNPYKVCYPAGGITTGQAVRVVTKWLDNHPKHLQLRDTTLAIVALTDAYPCKS